MTSAKRPQPGDFAPSESLRIGFEATYTGRTDLEATDRSDDMLTCGTDVDGNVYMRYSLWGFCYTKAGGLGGITQTHSMKGETRQ